MSSRAELERRRLERRKVPIHIAPRVPGAMVFAAVLFPLCGVKGGPGVKVAAAAGRGTCPECRRLYAQSIDSVKERGRRLWALAHRD